MSLSPHTNGASLASSVVSDVARSALASELMPGALADADLAQIPDIVIRRLPIYVRTLRALSERDVQSVSSEDLADLIGVTAAQIRRDLSYFGKFGKQGKGYDT
ncbi:MAG TPA: winged-helix domain-containing protein, partial [Thermomicrobiales bacterium]|nr:winged-helix domain-containing protein [Thermomicrobiales bacterium]